MASFAGEAEAIRVGIVGAGTIGLKHARLLRKLGASICGVVTNSHERRKQAQSEFDAEAFDTAEDLFGRTTPDAIVVASPNALHDVHIRLALSAGCHVLCEKPLASSAESAAGLVQLSQKVGRYLAVAYNLRYTLSFQNALKLVEASAVGQILQADARWVRRRGIPGLGRWNTTNALSGGGALLDAGIHLLDSAWLLMQRPIPVAVSAATFGLYRNRIQAYRYKSMWNGPPDSKGVMDVEDSCNAFIRFADGSVLTLDVCWARNGLEQPCSVSIHGSAAGLVWTKNGHVTVIDDTGEAVCESRASDGLEMHRAFLQNIGTESGPDQTAKDAVVEHRIIDAMYASAQTQREVVLSG